jgi:hypothetical protein
LNNLFDIINNPWTCEKCNKSNDGGMLVCSNCGESRFKFTENLLTFDHDFSTTFISGIVSERISDVNTFIPRIEPIFQDKVDLKPLSDRMAKLEKDYSTLKNTENEISLEIEETKAIAQKAVKSISSFKDLIEVPEVTKFIELLERFEQVFELDITKLQNSVLMTIFRTRAHRENTKRDRLHCGGAT